VSPNTQLDLEVRPLIQLIQKNGENSFFEREYLEKFQHGNLIYIKGMGLLTKQRPSPISISLPSTAVTRSVMILA
jgi:hypothetical protein